MQPQDDAYDDRDREDAETRAAGMKGVAVKMSAAASDEGRLFGSVTAQMIAAELVEKGHEVEAKQVLLDEPVREVGSYTIAVRLHRDVDAEVQLEVEATA